MAPNLWIAWPLLLIPNALNILWLGPVITAVQHLVPRAMRSTASASFLLINNLIGLGVGPYADRAGLGRRSSTVMVPSRCATPPSPAPVFYLLAGAADAAVRSAAANGWVEDSPTIG